MNGLATFRHSNRLGQEEHTSISCIPIPLRNAGKPRNKRGLEGVLKQHREIEAMTPQQAGERPFPRKPGMSPPVLIDQYPIQFWGRTEQLGNR